MIEFKNVFKKYKNTTILKNISFKIETGNIVCLIGESGCGKTTTLKMINRLIEPTKGHVLIDGDDVKNKNAITLRREIGYVIQQTGLFPHLTVRENIELIAKLKKIPKEEITKKIKEMLDMVDLDKELLDRYPTELSGGQQQRVGVARAFLTDPAVILMDEPFSALDPMTRNNLQDELLKIQDKFHKTIVFVTHDMDEAIKIADKICIMDGGKIIQYDTPENILKKPKNKFVSDFVGPKRIWTSPELIKIKDIMLKKTVTCSPNMTVFNCINRMKMMHVDTLMVVDNNHKYLGSIIASELTKNVNIHKPAKEYLSEKQVTVLNTDTIIDALKIVEKLNIMTIPVVNNNGVLVGLVSRSSLFTSLSSQFIEGGEL
ncbi:MAG TPA: ABC transporter ATP-binding protein [Candidatus Onthousia faecavium]|nr:ABC transporter ATP-binding protein [Candidatus Onthousia faecavium]